MDKLRILIVDDEALARERVQTLLNDEPNVEIVGECSNGLEAVQAIQEKMPDLVFLDIQMPTLDGFEVIQSIGADEMPLVIFVTAHDEFALKAFEVHALDYLLKPFDRHRFQQALTKARKFLERYGTEALSKRLSKLLNTLKTEKKYLQRLAIKSRERIFFLKIEDVDWIESAGNYAVLHLGKEEHLFRETMKRLENMLDPAKFVRIHRGKIVNIDRIKELQQRAHGEYLIILKNNTRLTLSRNYRENLLNHF